MTALRNFPIVGVGASAGGVEALEGFFRGMPDEPGLGFVIVTHLSPERESLLHEIVSRYTQLTVHVAANGKRVDKNCVYVLPADAILSIANGHLLIQTQNSNRRERKPIDVFFSSLPEDLGERSVGVILSGGDSDGTLGIKAIKARGGLTLAQTADGYGPLHPDMPDSAIATGLVDLAMPVEQMGMKLAEFARSLPLLDQFAAADPGLDAEGRSLEEARTDIYNVLRNQIGHDFSGYKPKTFMRRVQRRMQVCQVDSAEAYIDRLRQDPQEVSALFRDLLINVTNFFRDSDAFDHLANVVVPQLFEGRGADATVRVWVPGCATGEEVYSLGILLREHMDTIDAVPRVQIFATDIDERALAVARAARYPEQLLENVSPQRRDRFFIPDGSSFVVAKEVRDLCIFSPHSVIRDPPFSRIDLVSCRNLLIYFGVDVQNQVIPTFHYALRPEGFLFLGASENVTQFNDLFVPVEKKQRIFRRRADVTPRIRLPIIVSPSQTAHPGDFAARRPLGAVALRQIVDAHVLERFAPPHVVVNREGEIIFFSPRTGKYLEAAPGMPTRQLLTMARKGLRLDLRTVFRDAVDSRRSVTRDGIAVESDDGRVQVINLTVEPLGDRAGEEALFLVLFTDQGPVVSREEALSRAQTAHNGTADQIERELRDTRERLQSMVEEYETALEELKSSNEELVSLNEELQSTNEELEASKEELVSLNEELHTVNTELNGKVEALDRANSDLRNLFDSTSLATVFLDGNLVIRSFTPAMSYIFKILPSDVGRPITDLASQLRLPGFERDIAKVFADQEIIERRIDNESHTEHYLVRLVPYRDAHRTTDGVVVTFVDVSGLTRAEEHQRVLIAELQHRTRNLLAVVQSLAQQTLHKGPPLDAFMMRLSALGRLQGLVGKATNNLVALDEIVRLELEALGAAKDEQVVIEGPPIALSLDGVHGMALALHELATNAVKYGALKDSQGRLQIRWHLSQHAELGATLVFEWHENGLPVPPDSSRHGYGRKLIEHALAYTLRAKTKLRFEHDGVYCRIEMPLATEGPARGNDLTEGV